MHIFKQIQIKNGLPIGSIFDLMGQPVVHRGDNSLVKRNTLQSLKEDERNSRKKLIVDAAISLFSKEQISKVGMRDIAEEAGISPALIYRHFKDRDELFVAAFIEKSREMIINFEHKLSDQKIVSIEKIGVEFIHFLINNPLFFKMMTFFMLEHTLDEEHLEKFNLTIRELLSIFDKGFKLHGYKRDVRLHSHAFFAALNGIMITFYHYPGRSEEEVENHIEQLAKLVGQLFTNDSSKSR